MSLEWCWILSLSVVHLILGCGAIGYLMGLFEDDERPDELFVVLVLICLWPLVLAYVLAAYAGGTRRDRAKRQVKTSNDDCREL